MPGVLGRTGCEDICFPVHMGWNSRDVSVVGMCDCIKECVFCNVVDCL